MKQATRTALAALLLGVGMGPGIFAWGQQRTLPSEGYAAIEGYAAKVNDRVIMFSEVMAMVRGAEGQLPLTLQGAALRQALAQAYDDALNTLIERELILEEYEHKEGEIPVEAVDDQVKQVLAKRFDNDRSRLLRTLEQEHMSYMDWRQQIEEQLIISVMRREAVMDKLSLSPNAAREVYEANFEEDYYTPPKVKLRVFKITRGDTEEEVMEKASLIKDARSRIAAGESFDVVAKELSEGSKAALGGDWGWMPSRDLNSELAVVADQLAPGQLSEIISAGDHLYLVRVESRQPEQVVLLEEVRDILEQELRRAELIRIQDEWIARLRKKHFVQKF